VLTDLTDKPPTERVEPTASLRAAINGRKHATRERNHGEIARHVVDLQDYSVQALTAPPVSFVAEHHIRHAEAQAPLAAITNNKKESQTRALHSNMPPRKRVSDTSHAHFDRALGVFGPARWNGGRQWIAVHRSPR
jgi:hypothetical protein